MNCPICRKHVTREGNPFRPFCTERCKLLDFGNWADGNYSVPADEPAPALEDAEDAVRAAHNEAHGIGDEA